MNEALEFLKQNDERLARIIEITTLTTLQYSGAVFEDLVSCILDMQIRYRGTATRYKRLKQVLNNEPLHSKSIFEVKDNDLKFVNMSSQKYNALVALSSDWDAKNWDSLDWNNLSDEAIRVLLLQVKGIGNWTVDMILLYTLQRPNIFPIDDLQLKKAMAKVYEIDNKDNLKKEMQYISNDWQPYQSTAVLYLLENGKRHLL
jgi:DNA-3-methyladenine glycosylase II